MISAVGSTGRWDMFSAPVEGMRNAMNQANTAALNIAKGDLSPENAVMQIQAEVLVKANATAMRMADELLGTIIDLKA